MSSTYSLLQSSKDEPLFLRGIDVFPYSPVEKERDLSCPVSP